jgi:glycosyltransferase involved in cell wall biosynthesis
MKVLFLTSSYPVPELPALGVFVREHARAAALHAEVAVAHIERSEHLRSVRVEEVEDDEFASVRVRYPASPVAVSYAANVAATAIAYRRLRRGGFDPDVIHAHFFLAGAPAVLLGRFLRKPVVVTEQWSVFLPDDPMTLSRPVQRVARFTYEHAKVVMPVSAALRDGIRAVGARTDFRVVPNAVDTARFHPDGARPAQDGARRLIGVGNLYEAKGWDDLLDALAIVSEHGRSFHLDLFGGGVLQQQLEARVARLGLGDLVTFHGWRSKDEVAARLRESDLFVITSRYDSNPCALIEALASGVPVVGTAVGGIPEMVTDGMGILAETRRPERIAAAIEAALDRDWDRPRIAAAARDRYGMDRIGREFAAAYEDALRKQR